MEVLAIVPIAIGLTWVILHYRGNAAKNRVEIYLLENEVDAKVLKSGIPPLRYWMRNRKGDAWVKILYGDGVEQWVRVRKVLFGGWTYEFFD